MKAFYNEAELSKISDEELIQLVSFEGAGTTYYYSNLDKVFTEDDEEFCIRFKDGTEIFTKDVKVFNNVKFGKSRFDLMGIMLKDKEVAAEKLDSVYKSLINESNKQTNNVISIAENIKQENTAMIDSLQKQNEKLLLTLAGTLNDVTEKWNKKLEQVDNFNSKDFKDRMKKIDQITVAFSELLE